MSDQDVLSRWIMPSAGILVLIVFGSMAYSSRLQIISMQSALDQNAASDQHLLSEYKELYKANSELIKRQNMLNTLLDGESKNWLHNHSAQQKKIEQNYQSITTIIKKLDQLAFQLDIAPTNTSQTLTAPSLEEPEESEEPRDLTSNEDSEMDILLRSYTFLEYDELSKHAQEQLAFAKGKAVYILHSPSKKVAAASFRVGRNFGELTAENRLRLMRIAANHHDSRDLKEEIINRCIKRGKCHFAADKAERDRILDLHFAKKNRVVRKHGNNGYVVVDGKEIKNDPDYKLLEEATRHEGQLLLQGRKGNYGTSWVSEYKQE